jgi:bifunctional non-homologous end joining protein LigD
MTPATRTNARAKLAEYRRKRDFTKTAEPEGGDESPSRGSLRFVIQKHAASHLHFDFRLELDGVMKSWAVPKGPSLDPATKRLAMQVEDHPISYNDFEGTIPKGEYGGGTVMLWDQGTYGAADAAGDAEVKALRDGLRRGRLDLVMHGERLRGGFALVRMRGGDGEKAQWLLIKRDDETAQPSSDIVAEHDTSAVSGRTMDEIAAGKGKRRVWHSNRGKADDPMLKKGKGATKKAPAKKAAKAASLASRKIASLSAERRHTAALVPMKASIGTEVPTGEGWTFEPKYDGIRVIAYATSDAARVVTRNGNDKSRQFPEVVEALTTLARKARRPLVLDGEIVALAGDDIARFQNLQGRMHATDSSTIETALEGAPAALIAFDLLMDGDEPLLDEPWTARRARLEQRLRNRTSPRLRLGETVPNDGEEMLERARASGWEGIIAKRTSDPYRPGERSRGWLKLKIEHRQEFVVGGWTEPRNTREHIGAILLGYFTRDGEFVYVGHTGGGFNRESLKEMYGRLAKLEQPKSPFTTTPKTNEKPHWVKPKVVVEVKFGEWTADGKLRQPIFLGVRDDKPAREVTREAESVQDEDGKTASTGRIRRRSSSAHAAASAMAPRKGAAKRGSARATSGRSGGKRTSTFAEGPVVANAALVERLREIEESGGDGVVKVPGGELKVTSLDRVMFPKDGITKGALMRYYANVAPLILPALKDRPLVLKRTPEGIEGETFFQQKAPEHAPDVVRVETIEGNGGDDKERLIGGDLATLLFCVQNGCVSMDPWHSRVQDLDRPDYTYLDLDPQPKATFAKVRDAARWVKEELDELGLSAALKTSGSRGLHVAVPLPSSATWETAVALAQLIATRVAEKHPKDATVVRAVGNRPPTTIYVDYLQNIRGKSIAGAYCVRAKAGATVSTPLDWSELTDDLDPREFDIATAPARFAKVGDLWKAAMKQKNSAAALRKLAS